MVVFLWTWLMIAGVVVLAITTSSMLNDPWEPWERVADAFFWWPFFILRNYLAVPLTATWWLVLAWALALAVDRARARLWTAA